ncbi:putative photosynthetic complex assembly protein PuhE [Pelagibius sp.]|uniref:putative photosynthetic complex assembly protein PuhE n=1 Tax=Pelagibius sp. TaxID=1931238 RepID=UPI0026062C4A|nr:putative photosynthetic complex assembly protein PuhE [Pelagibius sp.]
MTEYGLPVLFALFVWWFSTGLILYLDGLPRHTFRWSMLGATLLLAASVYGLAVTKNDTSVAGAYWAFTFGLLVWGWQEISFCMGFVTGPRKASCPEGCSGWRHFGHAIQAILYHELAIIAGAVIVVAVTWNGANQVGTWTFMILWWMRQSAKLNVFLGVRNLSEEFLPEHMEFLKGFLTKKPMNLLFPISITVSTAILTWLVLLVVAPGASAFEVAGLTLLATMLGLAVLEHWFLVLPLPATSLWSWWLSSRGKAVPFDVETHDPSAEHDRNHERGAEGDHNVASLGVETWSAALDRDCDPEALNAFLHRIAAGAGGAIDRVKGIARAESGWLHFDLAGGKVSMAAFAPGEEEVPRIIAIGRGLDRPALENGIAGCVIAACRTQRIENPSGKETKNGLPELLRPAAY